jgi:hypothetical protein
MSAPTPTSVFAVVLVHPEIPPNTGNVIRLTAIVADCTRRAARVSMDDVN